MWSVRPPKAGKTHPAFASDAVAEAIEIEGTAAFAAVFFRAFRLIPPVPRQGTGLLRHAHPWTNPNSFPSGSRMVNLREPYGVSNSSSTTSTRSFSRSHKASTSAV